MAITNRPLDHGAIANAAYRHLVQDQEAFAALMNTTPVRHEGVPTPVPEGDACLTYIAVDPTEGDTYGPAFFGNGYPTYLEPLPDDEIWAELEINNWPCGYEIQPRMAGSWNLTRVNKDSKGFKVEIVVDDFIRTQLPPDRSIDSLLDEELHKYNFTLTDAINLEVILDEASKSTRYHFEFPPSAQTQL